MIGFRIDKLLKPGEENVISVRVVSAIIMSGKEPIGSVGKQQAHLEPVEEPAYLRICSTCC